jgi:YD repeat-containing protein
MHAALIKRRNQKMLSGINGRQLGVGLIVAMVILIIGLAIDYARAEPQTRLYDARGNSVGTTVPQGQGSVRYYDSRGNSLGTSTTNSTGTTTSYGPRGNVTGTAVSPSFGRGK